MQETVIRSIASYHIDAVVLHLVVNHPYFFVRVCQMWRVFRHRNFRQSIGFALHHDNHRFVSVSTVNHRILFYSKGFCHKTQMRKIQRLTHACGDAGDAIAIGDAAKIVVFVIHDHILDSCTCGIAHKCFHYENLAFRLGEK